MKLRRRRRSNIACLAATRPVRSQAPAPASSLHHSSLSLHPAPPPYALRRPASPPPRAGRAIFSSYPSSSCSASPPSFFIKLPKQQSVADVVPSQPVQLSYPTIACGTSSPHPCPSRWPACPPPFSLSPVSRCGPSTSSEAIGKQRPEMNYPVSSPSLMNK